MDTSLVPGAPSSDPATAAGASQSIASGAGCERGRGLPGMARNGRPRSDLGRGKRGASMSSPPTILVVDDHPDLREVLALVLEHHGFRVMVAGDGREALARAGECRPDVVLMDLMMPRMDGYEAARALNDNGRPEVPVVAVTASQVNREALLAQGFAELLRKPVRADDLLATIRRFTA